MAGEKNKVEQRIRLDTSQYRAESKKLATQTKSDMNVVNGELQKAGSAFVDYGNTVKKSAGSVNATLKDMAKAFGGSVLKSGMQGLAIGGAGAAAGFAKDSISQSVKSWLSFGEAMSRVQLKTGMSKKSLSELQGQLTELARTGASLSSIPDAFDEIFSATNDVGKAKEVMGDVSKFAAGTGDKDAAKVAEFVRRNLTSQNKEVNTRNTAELLNSVATMVKTGAFKTLDEAMNAVGGVDASAMGQSKISNKSVAGMLTAGSSVANREQSLAAINEIVKGSANAFAGNSVLAGMLGGHNPLKNGQLDTKALLAASEHYKKMGLKDADQKGLLMSSGLSEDAANGLINILKNADKFVEGIDKFNTGSTTAAAVVDSLNDNLAAKIGKLGENMKASWGEVFADISNLDFGKVMKDVFAHLGDILGSGAVALGGGAAATFGLKSAAGLLGLSGAASGAGGAAAAAGGTAAKVLGTSVADLGIGQAAAATGGGLGLGALAAGAGALVAGGAVGYKLDDVKPIHEAGASFWKMLGLSGDNSAEKFAREQQDFRKGKGFSDATDITKAVAEGVAQGMQRAKIGIDVQSRDPGLLATPRASDNPRDPRGF